MSGRTDLHDVEQVSGGRVVLLLDGGGRVVMCQGQLRTVTDRRAEDVCGRHVSELPVDFDGWDPVSAPLPPRDRSGWADVRQQRGTSVRVWWEAHLTRGIDGRGCLVEIVPARVAMRREENTALVRALFQQTKVGLAIHDLDLSTTRLNLTPESLGPPSAAGTAVDPLGKGMEEVVLPEDAAAVNDQLRRVADSGEPLVDWVHRARRRDAPELERVVSLSAFRLEDAAARPIGVAAIFTEVTDQYVARQRMGLLQSVTECISGGLDMRRIAEELAECLVGQGFADLVAVDLLEAVLLGEEPGDFRRGAPLRRVAVAAHDGQWPTEVYARGATFRLRGRESDNLNLGCAVLESELSDWRERLADDPARARLLLPDTASSFLVAPLTARGRVLGTVCLWRTRRQPPFGQADAELAQEIAARAALGMDNARRYTREQRTAEALQRSLLPQSASESSAVQTAGQYVPAATAAGMGGTWFDVIPLSSSRVAMAVGEVAGHGLGASAAMGRLRTAVQTLADLELPPSELLAHLNDLTVRLGEKEPEPGPDGDEPRSEAGFVRPVDPTGPLTTGATFLYCVYDAVEGVCEMVGAGHPVPVLVVSGGDVRDLELRPGPALGVGGNPFEPITVELPPGSLLAFFTGAILSGDEDGLRRHHLTRTLRTAVKQQDTAAEAANRVVDELLPAPPDEDVSLLVARPRRLDPDRVASFEFPTDPAVVARARKFADGHLDVWDLSHLTFNTELIISELVTNAIRYGGEGPFRLRLVLDTVLTCEVSDTNETQPRLRRARTTDEGGRGLFLVAQLSNRWGCRYTEHGKTLWTEQLLTDAAGLDFGL
ncbi:SpoIIE family protein phosphatase [Streptomyces sp. NPDC127039]|uniref:ATP-binding SpoIIE family protein phosphatase n=1 Tax=Streptomyces sp. NPDC127039 TaxID=3347115 RepID=UPI0036561EE1